jgi:hypothetical protein
MCPSVFINSITNEEDGIKSGAFMQVGGLLDQCIMYHEQKAL